MGKYLICEKTETDMVSDNGNNCHYVQSAFHPVGILPSNVQHSAHIRQFSVVGIQAQTTIVKLPAGSDGNRHYDGLL